MNPTESLISVCYGTENGRFPAGEKCKICNEGMELLLGVEFAVQKSSDYLKLR